MKSDPPITLDGVRRLARGFAAHPVARQRPLTSAARVLSWQVRSRLFRGPHKVPFINGTRLWARRGETGVTGNIYYGLHEFEHQAFIAHALRPGDLFADIGANAGSYTVLAAAVAGAQVVAVEPAPETIDRLRANVLLNRIGDRVKIEACALSERNGRAGFTIGYDTVNHIAAPGEEAETIDIPTRTADDLFAEDVPRILKVDVEGHEWLLLRGASRLLADAGLWALSVELSSAKSGSVVELLARHGFAPRRYDPFDRRLAPSAASAGEGNTLFLRLSAEPNVSARLASAEPLIVNGVGV